MLGKILKNICIFVVGMIFGVLALVGGGYLLVSKTKVGTITDKVSGAEKIFGEEIRDMTILETVKKLSDSSTTIGQYTDYFPCYFVKRFLMIFNENYLFLFIIPKNGEKIKQKRGRAGGTVA